MQTITLTEEQKAELKGLGISFGNELFTYVALTETFEEVEVTNNFDYAVIGFTNVALVFESFEFSDDRDEFKGANTRIKENIVPILRLMSEFYCPNLVSYVYLLSEFGSYFIDPTYDSIDQLTVDLFNDLLSLIQVNELIQLSNVIFGYENPELTAESLYFLREMPDSVYPKETKEQL